MTGGSREGVKHLLLATRSRHKLEELERILSGFGSVEVLGLDEAGIAPTPEEEELEPYDTFEENALSKAAYFQKKSGMPTVADDSGLEVDALGGAPGVRSKRFAPDRGLEGEERDRANNTHLIHLLKGVPHESRSGRYVCVAALDRGLGDPRTFRGEAPGIIVDDPRGDGGFGYDPHFLDPELGRTFAEISRREKNGRSHRGKAFRRLMSHLKQHPL